jgi:hypothetical protein
VAGNKKSEPLPPEERKRKWTDVKEGINGYRLIQVRQIKFVCLVKQHFKRLFEKYNASKRTKKDTVIPTHATRDTGQQRYNSTHS